MTGGGDPDNRHDFPGGWTEDSRNAFTEAGRTAEQQAMFAYVQTITAFAAGASGADWWAVVASGVG